MSAENLVVFLRSTVGLPLHSETNDDYCSEAYTLGLHFSFYEQEDFEDDQGINFSHYAYVLSFVPDRILGESSYDFSRQVTFMVCNLINQGINAECIGVENFQTLLVHCKKRE